MDKNNHLALTYFGSSDIGMVRQENQDSFAKLPENNSDLMNGKGHLFIVADGVGGHTGGKEASSMAVQIIGSYFNMSDAPDKLLLKKAFEDANQQIYSKAGISGEFTHMATTCSALLLKDQKGTIAHIGDSRIYRISNNKIEQLTKDHTQLQELLRQGVLTKKEAENYPNKSVLVRAMGAEEKIVIDLTDNISISAGESFVLCSDGLAKISEEEILQVVTASSPQTACDHMIKLANERGGKDNVTVLVIKLESDGIPVEKKKISKLLFISLLLFVTIASFAVLFHDQISSAMKDTISTDTAKTTALQPEKKIIPQKQFNEENPLIIEADNLFVKGRIERSLSAYKSVLETEPLNLRAIKGLNKIAEYYFQKAEDMRRLNNIDGAVKMYYKVNEIQPDHERSNYYIRLYRNRVNHTKPDSLK